MILFLFRARRISLLHGDLKILIELLITFFTKNSFLEIRYCTKHSADLFGRNTRIDTIVRAAHFLSKHLATNQINYLCSQGVYRGLSHYQNKLLN